MIWFKIDENTFVGSRIYLTMTEGNIRLMDAGKIARL